MISKLKVLIIFFLRSRFHIFTREVRSEIAQKHKLIALEVETETQIHGKLRPASEVI